METSKAAAEELGTSQSRWLAVATVAAATFLLVTAEFLPVALLTDIASEMAVSHGQVGLAVTAPGAIAAIAAPLLFLVAGKVDRKTLLIILTALIAATNLLSAIAPNFYIFFFARLLLGVGVGGLWATAVVVGRRLVIERHGGKATAIISAGIGIGSVAGVPVGALIGAAAGWRVSFFVMAIVGVAIVLAQIFILPRLPSMTVVRPADLAGLLKVRRACIGLVGVLVVACGHFMAYTFLELVLSGVTKLSPGWISFVLVAFAIGGLFGGFLGELLARRSYVFAIVSLALLQAASIAAVTATGEELTFVTASCMIWGLVFGGVPVVSQIYMYRAAPKAYEGGAALMVTFLQVGLATGGTVGGLVVDMSGVSSAFILGAVLSLLASGIFATAFAVSSDKQASTV